MCVGINTFLHGDREERNPEACWPTLESPFGNRLAFFFLFFFLTRLPTFINIFLLLLKNVFAYKEKKKKEAEAVTGSQSHLLHS